MVFVQEKTKRGVVDAKYQSAADQALFTVESQPNVVFYYRGTLHFSAPDTSGKQYTQRQGYQQPVGQKILGCTLQVLGSTPTTRIFSGIAVTLPIAFTFYRLNLTLHKRNFTFHRHDLTLNGHNLHFHRNYLTFHEIYFTFY